MHVQRRLRSIALILAIILTIGTPAAWADCTTQSKSAVLMDVSSGRVLYASNPDCLCYPASTTKIMTAIVALENSELTDVVTASRNAAMQEGSSIYLAEGEKLTMEELLYGLLLASGNDAAVAIAEHVAGSTEKFAAMMNQKAAELGATHTHFVNPNGLPDENHYTTAADLARMARYGLANHPKFREIVSTKNIVIPDNMHEWDRPLQNHNKLLWRYEGADGVKTGYTKAAGACLVASATRQGHQLVAVTLCSANTYDDVTRMLDYGFSNYQFLDLVKRGELVKVLPVRQGKVKTVGVAAARDLSMPVVAGEKDKIQLQFALPQNLTAPVVKGQKVGELILRFDGKEMTRVDLLANDNILKVSIIDGIVGGAWDWFQTLLNKAAN